MSQAIKIIDPEGYDFPQPKYHFGQTVIDNQFEIGFIIGMIYEGTEWEYKIYFSELEVTGRELIKESNLSLEIVEVENA